MTTQEHDIDDSPNPEPAAWPDCQSFTPDAELMCLAAVFVELREGLLSEGQVIKRTGLDRVAVRRVADAFDTALQGLTDELLAVRKRP